MKRIEKAGRLFAAVSLLVGCSERETTHVKIEPPPAAKQPVEKPKSMLPSLETLMPKFEVRSNAPNDFRVAFKSRDATEWEVVDVILPTLDDAEAVIAKSKAKLEMKYEVGKQLSDALAR